MKIQGVAQFGSVSVLGTGGRRFKSCHLDNFSFFHFFIYKKHKKLKLYKFDLPLFKFKKKLNFSASIK